MRGEDVDVRDESADGAVLPCSGFVGFFSAGAAAGAGAGLGVLL
ncbi:hypothetical protein [Dermatophilus congolensis]|nr:hypothetical protein [Dermatophilus congolensis]